MAGPARAGALIYAFEPARLADFYAALLGMRRVHGDDEHVVLSSVDFQLIVHAIPPAYRAELVAPVPPAPRTTTAIKLFFTVPDLAGAERETVRRGGSFLAGEWSGPGFRVRNACDPEGNVFQLRQPVA